MALDSELRAITYSGNDSTSLPYYITFRFLDADHIKVQVTADGEEEATALTSVQFTVHGADGAAPYVTTEEEYPSTTTVEIYRWMPYLQPVVLSEGGKLSTILLERALDRLTMLIMQAGDGGYSLPSEGVRSVAVWGTSDDRATVLPAYAGQLGVQIQGKRIYVAYSTATGDWRRYVPPQEAASQTALTDSVTGISNSVTDVVSTPRGGAYRRPEFGDDVEIVAGNGSTIMQMQPSLWRHQGRSALIYSLSTSTEFANAVLEIRTQNPDLTWEDPITPFPVPDTIDAATANFIQAYGTEIEGVTYFVAQSAIEPETPGEKFDCYVFQATDSTLTDVTRLAKLRLPGNDWTIPSCAIVVAHDDSWVFAAYVKGTGGFNSAVYAVRSTDQGASWEFHAMTPPDAPYVAPSETQLFVRGRTLEAWTRNDDLVSPTSDNEVILKCVSLDAGQTWGAITACPNSPDPEIMNGPWGARDGPSLMYVGRNSASLERFRVVDPLHSSLWLLPGAESYSMGGTFLSKGPGSYQFVRSRNGTLLENTVTLIPDVLLDLTVGDAAETGRGLAVAYSGGVAGVDGWEQTITSNHAVIGAAVSDFARLHDGSVPIMLGISGKFDTIPDNLFLLSTNAGSSTYNGFSLYLNGGNLRIQLTAGGGLSETFDVPAAVGEFGYIIHIGAETLTVWDAAGRRLGAKDISSLARNYGFNAAQLMCLGKSETGVAQAATGLILRRVAIWTTEATGAAVTAMREALI